MEEKIISVKTSNLKRAFLELFDDIEDLVLFAFFDHNSYKVYIDDTDIEDPLVVFVDKDKRIWYHFSNDLKIFSDNYIKVLNQLSNDEMAQQEFFRGLLYALFEELRLMILLLTTIEKENLSSVKVKIVNNDLTETQLKVHPETMWIRDKNAIIETGKFKDKWTFNILVPLFEEASKWRD